MSDPRCTHDPRLKCLFEFCEVWKECQSHPNKPPQSSGQDEVQELTPRLASNFADVLRGMGLRDAKQEEYEPLIKSRDLSQRAKGRREAAEKAVKLCKSCRVSLEAILGTASKEKG